MKSRSSGTMSCPKIAPSMKTMTVGLAILVITQVCLGTSKTADTKTAANSSLPTKNHTKRSSEGGHSGELFRFHELSQEAGYGGVIGGRGAARPLGGEEHSNYHYAAEAGKHGHGHAQYPGISASSGRALASGSSDSTASGPPYSSSPTGGKFPSSDDGFRYNSAPSPPPSYFRRPKGYKPPFVFPELETGSHHGDSREHADGFVSPFSYKFEEAGPTASPTVFPLYVTPAPHGSDEQYEFSISSGQRKPTRGKGGRKRPSRPSPEYSLPGIPSYPPSTPNPHSYFPLHTSQQSGHHKGSPHAQHPFLQDPWSTSSVEIGGNEHPGYGDDDADYGLGESHGYTIACTDFRGHPGQCVPPVKCTRYSFDIGTAKGNDGDCEYHHGAKGVCCPVEYEHDKGRAALLQLVDFQGVPRPQFSKYDVDEACYAGIAESENWGKIATDLITAGRELTPGLPAFYHHGLIRVLTDQAANTSQTAVAGMQATNHLIKRFQLNPIEGGFQMKAYTLEDSVLSDRCSQAPRCLRDAQFYRTFDGSCNSLENPSWGMAKTGMTRLLPPTYEDGVFAPRTLSVTGQPLASPRVISAAVVGDIDKPHPIFTNLVSDWGQFMDHDFAHLGMFKLDARNNSAIRCCQDGRQIQPSPHPACMPIQIPRDDPFFSKFRQTCMEFVRSLPAFGCNLGYVDQMDQVTHFIDASTIYGSEDDVANSLRLFNNGQLNVLTAVVDRPLLPLQQNDGDGCSNVTINRRCFFSGDDRVNQNVMLVLHHTVFTREHNRIAAELQTLNPRWNDELLFQEARRIVIAEIQHITYNEFLRLLIGERTMAAYRLNPTDEGYSKDYDQELNPTITNEFATAGYRLHSLPSGVLRPVQAGQKKPKGPGLLLRDLFFDPVIPFDQQDADDFLRGMATQPVQQMDNIMTIELTQHMFAGQNPFGLDLASLNIQRGRDHGLPTYNTFRENCGLKRARDWDDLADVIPAKVLKKFRQVYAHVDDVDLWLGGLSERPLDHDAVLGPTFSCIIADQFTRLKRGDRFFYEFGGQPASFTKAQLKEIRRSSLARIYCDNTDVGEMQPLVFIQPSKLNKRVNCNSTAIPRMNLRLWKDTRFEGEGVATTARPYRTKGQNGFSFP